MKCKRFFLTLVLACCVFSLASAQEKSGALKLIDRIESDLQFTLQKLSELQVSIPILEEQIKILESSLSASDELLQKQTKLLLDLKKQLADQLGEYDALLQDYRRLEISLKRWKVISAMITATAICFVIFL